MATVSAGPSALSIGGGPGVGKTALWRFAISDARARGHRVLISRPAEEEMPLSGVGLTDFFEGYRLAGLTVGTDDPFSTGRAVLGALRDIAGDGSAVLAIDDVQWLDSFSARSLRYALRRLETEPIAVVTTLRHDAAHVDPLALASTLPPERQDVVEPGPLHLDDIRRLIGDSGGAISRPTLRRIAEMSAGNPLYALELARALRVKGTDTSAGPLPLPDSVQLAIGDRVGSHAGDVGTLLEIVSAMGRSSVGALREISLTNDLDEALGVAQEERLLVVEDDLTVRFSHPMVGSVVYARIDPIAKRALHARLAALASEPDVRARHVALSTESAGAEAAALLEDAAARANRRGAPDLAADFIAHSLRLTPVHDEEAVRRRRLQQIAHLAASGEAGRALVLADELLASLPPGPARAEVLVQRFEVEDDDLAFGERLLEEALDDAGEDEALRGRVLDMLAWLRGMLRGNLQDGIRALAPVSRSPNARRTRACRCSLVIACGDGGAHRSPSSRSAQRNGGPGARPWAQGTSEAPRALSGKLRFWAGDLPGARERFDDALEAAAREGMELTRPYRLYDLSLLECAAGNLVEARELARLGIEAAEDARFPPGWLHYPSALVSAWLGHAADARRSADLLPGWARPRGERTAVVRALMVQGLVALSEGDAADARSPLAEAVAILEAIGVVEPGAFPVLPDAIEAFARSGDIGRAEALLAQLEAQAERVDNAWARAGADRGRGAILVASGQAEDAVAPLRASAEAFDTLGFRPDAARAVLLQGQALLRGGHRTAAADALDDARERCASMGAKIVGRPGARGARAICPRPGERDADPDGATDRRARRGGAEEPPDR